MALVASFAAAVIAAFFTDMALSGIFTGFQNDFGNWNLLSVGIWWLLLFIPVAREMKGAE